MIWLHGIAQANWQCHLYGVPLIDATDLQTATTRNVHEQWQWQYNRDAIRDRNRRCRAHWGDRGLDISIMYLLCRRLPVFVAVDAVVGLAICSDFVYYYFFVLLPSTSLSVPSFSSRVFFPFCQRNRFRLHARAGAFHLLLQFILIAGSLNGVACDSLFDENTHTHRYALSLPPTKVEMAQRHNAPIVLFSFSSRSNCIRESKNVGIIAFAFYTLYSPVELHREVHAVNSFFNRSTKKNKEKIEFISIELYFVKKMVFA